MVNPIRTCSAMVAGLSMATAIAVNAQTADLPKVEYTKFELPNGLRVILTVDKSAPVICTFVHYHVGSKNERPDRTGFAHFFEHLMFEGTDNIERHSIDKIVQSAGGRLNAYTTFDETAYHIELPSNQLKLALWLESERMMHARVEEIGVETQRSVVKEERKNRYDNTPYGSVLENLAKYVGEGTAYAWTPIGSAQYIDQATIGEFREFYKTYYVPNNAVLVVAGDIDLEKTKKLINDYFADIPRGKDVVRPTFTMGLGKQEKVVDVREDKTPLPALLYAYRAPRRGDRDAYAMEVLTTILTGGNSSRLHVNMMDTKQLAVAVQGFPIDLENGGMVGFFAVAHPTTTMEQLGAEFNAEIDNVQKSGVTEEEFTKAMNQVETDFAGRFTKALDKARALAGYETFFNDPSLINTELTRYTSLKREDIQRVAQTYMVPSNRVILKYYPASRGGH